MMKFLRKSKRGVTLIELTIMIGVAAVLFYVIGRAATTLAETAVQNRDYLIALNLAKQQMAMINNAAYPAVAAEAALTADAAFPNFIPTQTVTSVAVSGANSIRQITVRVRYNSVAGAVLIRLDTYRSDIITFGDGT